MRPLIGGMPGVVIELKAADKETEDLDALARVSHTPRLSTAFPPHHW